MKIRFIAFMASPSSGRLAMAGLTPKIRTTPSAKKAESVYLVMLCGLPWRAVIIIKSDDYCA
jgi:hypothetical protein